MHDIEYKIFSVLDLQMWVRGRHYKGDEENSKKKEKKMEKLGCMWDDGKMVNSIGRSC